MILAIVIAVIGTISFGITIYCFKTRYGLSWTFCKKTEDDIKKEAVSELDLDLDSPSVN